MLNIMGGESRQVTPTSHAFSGGNVVFGTSPGRAGPGAEDAGRRHSGLQQRPRGAGRRASPSTPASSTCRPRACATAWPSSSGSTRSLQKIVIITEKIAVHDAREIRAMAQANGVDIIGGNCLGVADSWNRVRIGGALGGDHPDESLIKGSVAIFSNSGGFTTTIAQYLGTAGWGTTTLVSSAARTSTSTMPARTSPAPSRRTTGRRRRCSMPSPAATTSTASSGRSRSSPASSVAGSRS